MMINVSTIAKIGIMRNYLCQLDIRNPLFMLHIVIESQETCEDSSINSSNMQNQLIRG